LQKQQKLRGGRLQFGLVVNLAYPLYAKRASHVLLSSDLRNSIIYHFLQLRAGFPDKQEIDQAFRILMRSRHIYILFSALIHLALGVYLPMRPLRWQKVIQLTGSAVLTASSILLAWAFVVETYETHGFTTISRYGIYTSLAGIVLHLPGGIGGRRNSV
jgi:hypothetical protein